MAETQNTKQGQYCKKFNQDFKNGPGQKKKSKKKQKQKLFLNKIKFQK